MGVHPGGGRAWLEVKELLRSGSPERERRSLQQEETMRASGARCGGGTWAREVRTRGQAWLRRQQASEVHGVARPLTASFQARHPPPPPPLQCSSFARFSTYCKCTFQVFQMFQKNVASVSYDVAIGTSCCCIRDFWML